MADRPALLLVGHGSRQPEAAIEMVALTSALRSRLDGVTVTHGWIELVAPPALVAGEGLVDAGHRQIVVVPLLAFAAYHARVDVEAVADRLRSRADGPIVAVADVLGPDERMLDLAAARIGAAGDATAAVVIASGTSDASVQAEIAALAPALAQRTGRPVRHAFASLAGPTPDAAVADLAAAGHRRVAVFSWSLLDGHLRRRAHDAAADAAVDAGTTLVDAGWFGPDRVIADVLADRYVARCVS